MSHELVSGWPAVVRIPVQWGEMDAYGHVNNTAYFRYFESARVAYLEACGFTDSYRRRKVGAILRSTECRFRYALTYPDEVDAGARATRLEEDRFTMEYRVVSRSADRVAAEGTGVVVSFDYEAGEKVPVPEDVADRIAEMEERGPE